MTNDPRVQKFHDYKFADYVQDQTEIAQLRATLDDSTETSRKAVELMADAVAEVVTLRTQLAEVTREKQKYFDLLADACEKTDRLETARETVTGERDRLRDSLRKLQADAFMSGVAGNHLACAIPYAVEWEKFTRDQAHDYFVSRNRNQVAYEVWTAWRILMDCSQRQRGEAAYDDVLARLNEWESDTALSAQPEPKSLWCPDVKSPR